MWVLRATAAVLLAAFLLASPPLPAAREAEPLPLCPRPAPALFSAEADGGVLLVRVYANAPRDDEFVEIGNRQAVPLDLTGWSLTDR
ncbi:MAG: lamin tail domain-containing protein, partial [Methanobacteriota archaeon]